MAEFNSKNQLRGKDGKWVFMGGSVKWFDPITNTYMTGKIVKIEGDKVTIEREDGTLTEVNQDNISTIAAKASLTPEDEKENEEPDESPLNDPEEIKEAPIGQEISVTLNGVKTHFKKTGTDTWQYTEGAEDSPELNDADFKFVIENGNVKKKSTKPVTAAVAPESDTVFGLVTDEEGVEVIALVKDEPEGTFFRAGGNWQEIDADSELIAGNWIEVVGEATEIFDANESAEPTLVTVFDAVIVD